MNNSELKDVLALMHHVIKFHHWSHANSLYVFIPKVFSPADLLTCRS